MKTNGMKPSRRRSVLSVVKCSFLLVALFPPVISAASSSSTRKINRASSGGDLPYNKPDRWVAASPLAVAAVCRDGVALVATHTAASSREPLLLPRTFTTKTTTTGRPALSLPPSYRGPLRIARVDGTGTCLVSAGWRTDCEAMAEHCRSYAADETARYGGDGVAGRVLAAASALWMAQCAFSSSLRALSCVGLLASCIDGDGNDSGGSLWLVDATGAYQVRAFAVGLGARPMNRRLSRIDFSRMTKEEGVRLLLKTIFEVAADSADESKSSAGDDDKENKDASLASYYNDESKPFHVEAAVLDFSSRSMQRLRDPF